MPVHIVEDHNDALRPILRGIATKHLPFAHNLLVHFDSHPDLLLPAQLLKSEVYDKEILFERLSIENWILPAAFAGHFDTIVWVKPPWSNQIPDGEYHFSIGIERETGFVKVSSGLLYFVSEMLYCSEDKLEEKKDITLHVVTLGDRNMTNQAVIGEYKISEDVPKVSLTSNQNSFTSSANNDCNKGDGLDVATTVRQLIEEHNRQFVLDIDLDFFTTLNPFMETHKDVNMYSRLQSIYKFNLDFSDGQTIDDNQTRRMQQMMPLEHLFKELEEIKAPDKIRDQISTLVQKILKVDDRKAVKGLVLDLLDLETSRGPSDAKEVKERPSNAEKDQQEVDWLLIHDAGCTWDSADQVLPHHPSTDDEIRTLMHDVTFFLDQLADPKLVTWARSSLDDYCPPNKVNFVQELLSAYFRAKFDGVQFIKHY